jgi:fructosamine-3-kinase
MIPEPLRSSIESYLREFHNKTVKVTGQQTIGGGSINDAWRLDTETGPFFLKYNNAGKFPAMFEKEARGLELLASAGAIKVPEVIHYDSTGIDAYLLLEYLEPGVIKDGFWEQFGQELAMLHRNSNDYFGLDHDNYMGSLYQYNSPHHDWPGFFVEQRLEKQVAMAKNDGAIGSGDVALFDKLYPRLDTFFPQEAPALVHGDLWSGNFMAVSTGKAAIIDPAAYYGHREVDIAMSTLFGSFSNAFYTAYNEAYPMEQGWQERLDIYNLYPLMVHVNLFGGGYMASVKRILKRFV